MVEQYEQLCSALSLPYKQCCNCGFAMADVADDLVNPLRWWNCARCYRYLCVICADITAKEEPTTVCVCRKCALPSEKY